MTTRILGPLDTGGRPLSPRERTILEALIVRRNTTVAPDELADACWGDDAPRTWPQQVRNTIAKIRAKLGADVIRTVGESYRLGIDGSSIDAVDFERLVAQARRHDLEGSPDRAVAAYRRALALWRGDPYPDLSSWPAAVTETMRLRELRTCVEEEMLDARLRTGEDAALVPEAERLVREEPLREHRWAILALANYRADRQAQAIAVLRAARRRLVDDLGIDPSRSLVDLEAAILRQDASLERPDRATPSESPSTDCPYRGLAAFDVGDAGVFFGRDIDAAALAERCGRRAVVAVVGPSGCGKSSLVRAGLVPVLRDRGSRVTIVTPSGLDERERSRLFDSDIAVVVLDQAEEMLGEPEDAIRDLVARAHDWVEQGGCLILTLRSDFLDRATALPRIGVAIGQGTYALSPLTEAGLRRAISGPAEAAGLRIESGLPEVILHDAGDRPGILPALSHALVSTWARREGSTLTIAGYEEAGGIAGAIAQSAERVYRGLSPAGQTACRSVLMRMVERTPEAATLRRRVPLGTLAEDPTRRSVVEGLVAARLVTIDGDAAVVAHEAVGHTWPRLDGWLTDDEVNAQMLRRIESAASAWHSAGREDEDLLRGGRLHAALEWRENAAPDLTETEAAFIDASTELHQSEVRDLEQQASRERRRNRGLRFALVAASVLLIAAVVASAIAVTRTIEAGTAEDEARLAALTATSANLQESNPSAAALLAAEAANRWPDHPDTRHAMESVIGTSALTRSIAFPDDAVIDGALIPGTRTALVAVGTETGEAIADVRLHIVDLDTGVIGEPLEADLPDGWGPLVEISADGSTAYIQTAIGRGAGGQGACCMNYFTIVDVRTGRLTTDTVLLDARTTGPMAITDDGERAYFMHPITGDPSWIERESGNVVALSPHDPAAYENVPGVYDGVALVEDELLLGSGDRIDVHDASSLAFVRTIPLSGGFLADRQLVPDGTGGLLAFGNAGATHIDLATGRQTWVQDGSVLQCPIPMAFTANGFICGSGPNVYTEHDLLTGEPTGIELTGLSIEARRVASLPDTEDVVIFVSLGPPAILRWRLGLPLDTGAFTNAELRTMMCTMAGRQLTEDEWQTYLGDEQYRHTCPDV